MLRRASIAALLFVFACGVATPMAQTTNGVISGIISDAQGGVLPGVTLTTETTLTIASILYSGTAARCPDIRFIWSHGGGTMPYITSRLGAGNPTVLREMQKFYYDTAQAFNEFTLPTFTKLVPNPHILFGTDYPFVQAGTVAKGLAAYGFAAANLRAIERDNALELFPRLRRA